MPDEAPLPGALPGVTIPVVKASLPVLPCSSGSLLVALLQAEAEYMPHGTDPGINVLRDWKLKGEVHVPLPQSEQADDNDVCPVSVP